MAKQINIITCEACKDYEHFYQHQVINICHSPDQGQVPMGTHNDHLSTQKEKNSNHFCQTE